MVKKSENGHPFVHRNKDLIGAVKTLENSTELNASTQIPESSEEVEGVRIETQEFIKSRQLTVLGTDEFKELIYNRELEFSNYDLSLVDFNKLLNENISLEDFTFKNCRFDGANLSFVTFSALLGCSLKDVLCYQLDFSEGALIISCDFSGAILGLVIAESDIVLQNCIFKNIRSVVPNKKSSLPFICN